MESPTKTRGRRTCPTRKHPKLQNIPSSLKDSPYLSNSIHSITNQDNHDSGSTRRSKRTPKNTNNTVNKNKNNKPSFNSKGRYDTITDAEQSTSPAHPEQSYPPPNNHYSSSSTIASLRLESPYSESVFSLKSASPYSSNAGMERRNVLYRSVLLPHEVDDLKDEVLIDTNNSTYQESEGDEYYYSESDESINSEMAFSINDETVFLKLIEMKHSPRRQPSNQKVQYPSEKMMTPSPEIKLPPVASLLLCQNNSFPFC